MFACSISDERVEVGVGHCLPNLVKWQWLHGTGLSEEDYMDTLFVLRSREGLCGESRDLGGMARVCRSLLLASYCCVWGCTYTMRPHIKGQTVYISMHNALRYSSTIIQNEDVAREHPVCLGFMVRSSSSTLYMELPMPFCSLFPRSFISHCLTLKS